MFAFSSSHTFILLSAVLGLGACAGGSSAPPPPPNYTINTLPVGSTLLFTPQAGFEALTFSGQQGSLSTALTARFVTTNVGLDLVVEGGGNTTTVNFDTRTGGQMFSNCQPCVSGLVRTTWELTLTNNAPSALTYATYGVWETITPLTGFLGSKGVFATGVATLPADRPTMGTATYTGKTAGFIAINGAAAQQHRIAGDLTLTADFAANTIAGNITNVATIRVFNNIGGFATGETGFTNNIALTGGIITGANYIGAATPAAATPATTVDISGATGRFGGIFYGPGAVETAGSLALTGANVNVIASFGGKK